MNALFAAEAKHLLDVFRLLFEISSTEEAIHSSARACILQAMVGAQGRVLARPCAGLRCTATSRGRVGRFDAIVCGADRYAEQAAPVTGCRLFSAVFALHNDKPEMILCDAELASLMENPDVRFSR